VITARVVTAVAIAGMVSLPLGVNRAYWVIMVAGAVLQASHVRRLTAVRTVQRVLGTVVSVAVFAVLVALQPTGLWLVAMVTLLQLGIEGNSEPDILIPKRLLTQAGTNLTMPARVQ
jgi:uncharacterized membrane protein YccC